MDRDFSVAMKIKKVAKLLQYVLIVWHSIISATTGLKLQHLKAGAAKLFKGRLTDGYLADTLQFTTGCLSRFGRSVFPRPKQPFDSCQWFTTSIITV